MTRGTSADAREAGERETQEIFDVGEREDYGVRLPVRQVLVEPEIFTGNHGALPFRTLRVCCSLIAPSPSAPFHPGQLSVLFRTPLCRRRCRQPETDITIRGAVFTCEQLPSIQIS